MPANKKASLLDKIKSLSFSQIKNLLCSDNLVTETRRLCENFLGSSPCLWQIRVAFAILKGESDVICVARTGAGKSLTFYLPLAIQTKGIVIIVVPLNALASEMAATLSSGGISAIAITASNSSKRIYKVSNMLSSQDCTNTHIWQDVTDKVYRGIITNPETLLEPKGRFLDVLRDRAFARHLTCIIIDEAHCVVNWGSFRPEYKEMGLLRHILPSSTPIYVVSATLPPTIMQDVRRLIRIRKDAYEEILSNDRSNVALMVRRITHPLHTYWDLSFLVPEGWKPGDEKPLLFLVMFDQIRFLQEAVEFLRKRLSKEHRDKIVAFHSELSEEHRLQAIQLMKSDALLGVCASEGFGLVSKTIRMSVAKPK